jgi:hypothetical protein
MKRIDNSGRNNPTASKAVPTTISDAGCLKSGRYIIHKPITSTTPETMNNKVDRDINEMEKAPALPIEENK